MSWIERFKIALIEEDEAAMAELLASMPDFDDIEEMRSAQRLIVQAIEHFEGKMAEVARIMKEIETSRKFLTSDSDETPNRLDITS